MKGVFYMATFKQYTKANGKSYWMFSVYAGLDNAGKQRNVTRRGFKTQKEAELGLARFQLGLEQPKKEVKKESQTFSEVYDLWLEEYESLVKPSTLLSTEQIFKHHIIPSFGELKIDEVTPLDCQKILRSWSKFVKANTFMNYASSVFDFAIRMQLITSNPAKVIRKKKRVKKVYEDEQLNFYDKDELKEFIKTLERFKSQPKIYNFFRLLAFTGIRKGEILALTWSDIDFSRKTLSINKAVARTATGLKIQTPKTVSSNRLISLDDKTLKGLKSFKGDKKSDELIFPSENSGILSTAKPRKWLLMIQDELDRGRKKPMKRITTHGFRHTHASLLFESGATIKDVQMRLGHSDIKTTMDVYTHVSKHAREQLAERFNNFVDF